MIYTPQDVLNYLNDNDFTYEHLQFGALKNERSFHVDSKYIVKCLAVTGKKGNYIFCLPINESLDYKKIRKSLNEKSIRLADNVKDVTGYDHGSNGPLAIKLSGRYQGNFFVDQSLVNDFIVSNIGEYGNTVLLQFEDFNQLIKPVIGDFIKKEEK